jgi:hypothetical protein
MIIPHDDNSDIMLPNASLQPGDLVPYDEEMADAAVARESARVDGGDMRVVSHDDVMPGCARPYRASTMPGSEKKSSSGDMDIHGVVQRSLNNSSNSGSGSGSPCARFVNGALDAFVDNCLPKLHDKIEFNISRTDGDAAWRTASIVDIDEPRGCMIVIVEPHEASLYPAREIRQKLGFPQPNETHKYRWRPMGSALPYRTPMREARRHGDVLVRCSPCIMYLLFDTSLLDAMYFLQDILTFEDAVVLAN